MTKIRTAIATLAATALLAAPAGAATPGLGWYQQTEPKDGPHIGSALSCYKKKPCCWYGPKGHRHCGR